MKLKVILFLLAGICSLGLWGQEKKEIPLLIGSVDNKLSYHVFIKSELVYQYLTGGAKNEAGRIITSKLSEPGVLPLISPDYAYLSITIGIPENHPNYTPSRPETVTLNLSTTGVFGTRTNELIELKLRKNQGYSKSIDIPISGPGKGSIKIGFLLLGSTPFDKTDNINIETYNHTVYGSNKALTILDLPTNSLNDKIIFVKQGLEFNHYFSDFSSSTAFSKTNGYSGVISSINNINSKIQAIHSTLSSQSTLVGVRYFYKVFGQNSLQGNPLARPFRSEADNKIKAAEEAYKRDNSGDLDHQQATNRLDEYEEYFCGFGYACRYKEYFIGLIPSPDPVGEKPCDGLDRDYSKINSIRSLQSSLDKCVKNNCPDDTCQRIRDRIEVLNCQTDLNRAREETDIDVRRSILQALRAKNICSPFHEEAKKMLEEIQALEIAGVEGPLLGSNSITGGRTLTYTVQFTSGHDIKLISIDGLSVDSVAQFITMKWQEKDSIFNITLTDREEEYELLFQSLSTLDEDKIVLSKEKFTAEVMLNKKQVLIKLQNGSSPYTALFTPVSGRYSFSVMIDSISETLDLKELGMSYQGEFELMILDNNGKEGLTETVSVQLTDSRLPLWLLLLLPLVLLTGFIIYRNIPVSE